ncbi:MAG: hypothetical protein OCD03_05630 [Hyphomicrobiales bacterium]
MKNNVQLVEFFIKYLNANELDLLSDLVTKDFIYDGALQHNLNFSQYCNLVSYCSAILKVEALNISTVKNSILVDMNFHYVDNAHSFYSSFPTSVEFKMHNRLIQSIHAKFHTSQDDDAYLKKTFIDFSLTK